MYEFSDFLVNVLKIKDLGATFPHTITYHDSCAALREYGLTTEPRTLLSFVRGLTLVEMKENKSCCGAETSFSMKHENISTSMADQKVQNALATGAQYIVSTDASCLMHQDGYIKKQNLAIQTIHLIDVLASGWE